MITGCADGVESDKTQERVGRSIQPIIRGVSSGTEHDAVVVLTTFEDGLRRSLCTATLVAPNLIITARHCVSDTETTTACSMEGTPLTGGAVKADRDPTSLVVFLGKSGVAPDTESEANGSARGSKIVVDSATNVCNRDIAFVVLDKKLAAPVAPIRLGAPTMDEKLAAVGWGIDETGTLPKSREVRADIPLIGVGPAMYPDNTTYGYGDREFMVGESACAGDSGSPAFAQTGAVVGVAARAGNGKARDPNNYASTCMGETAHAVYTHLSPMTDLVARAFTESGEQMWLEGEPDPRAPKPQNAPEAPAAEPPRATKQAAVVVPPAHAEANPESATGCSISVEPQQGSVEYAAGLVALLASIFGLRRRLHRKDASAPSTPHRASMPSVP
jgi:hypothetical protein